ncbi:MAG: hypothetical protein IAC13_10130 [Firmicutes bacterium]|uniref:Uncharacterized protein n=1 Tax=Candidatus Scybalomonas excrementavium TaxID=2840943 RepID=A0A9D9I3C5_9FIRM|nr:hypothetical protein [Candidatus Scybalomonas excrementavium]
MKKTLPFLLILLIVIFLFTHYKEVYQNPQENSLTIYSFHGENEEFSITNGVIVLSENQTIFSGGDLHIKSKIFSNIHSVTKTFYTIINDEEHILLSNRSTDTTGTPIHMDGSLGKITGEAGVLKNISSQDLQNNLYFKLITADSDGQENEYVLQLSLSEVTENIDNTP